MDKLRTKVAFYPWLVRITVENETAGEVPHAPHAHHQRSCWVGINGLTFAIWKMDLYGKELSFGGHHFPGAVQIQGVLSVKVIEACEYDSKLISFSGLHDFDHIYVDTYYIYVCNYRILEILSSGNFLLVVLFWCGKETHQPDCCSF